MEACFIMVATMAIIIGLIAILPVNRNRNVDPTLDPNNRLYYIEDNVWGYKYETYHRGSYYICTGSVPAHRVSWDGGDYALIFPTNHPEGPAGAVYVTEELRELLAEEKGVILITGEEDAKEESL